MKSRNFLLVIVVILMLGINSIDVMAHSNNRDTYSLQQYQAPMVVEIEMLPDPLLNTSQSVVIEGSSDNFGWTHTLADEPGNYNNLSLTWNHTAGDTVNFRSPTALNPNYPESYDFIYVKQTFEWSENVMPDEVSIRADVFFTFQYDFDYHNDYFKQYIWLIDSSGDWIKIRESQSIYPYDFFYFGDNLNTLQIRDVWAGLIQDENGIQTDPDDTLTLAVGFAPSLDFVNHTDTLNGSVTMTIRELSLQTYYDQIRDHEREPDVVGSIDTTSTMGLYGLDSAPDGSLYTVSTEGGYEEYNYDIIVQKWSSQCVPLWSSELRGPDIHNARDFKVLRDGSVLVLGYESRMSGLPVSDRYPMLARWNTDGDLIWKHVIEDLQEYRFEELAVAQDGSMFIGGNYDNTSDGRSWAALAKLNQEGTVLWTRTWTDTPIESYTYVYQIIIGDDGEAFVRTSWGLYRFEDSIPVRIIDNSVGLLSYHVSDVDSAGNLVGNYFDYYFGTGLGIFKMNRNGTILWNSTWGRDWHHSMSLSYAVLDLEVGVDGSVYLSGATWFDHKFYFYIVKWSGDGTVLTDAVWTYNNEEANVFSPGSEDCLAVGSNGYVYSVTYMIREQGATIQVSGFRIGPLGPSILLDPIARVFATMVGSSLGLVVLMHLARKRGIINTQPRTDDY